MKRLAILCALFCAACSEPPSKENSSTNAEPNNVNSSNVNPNNVNSSNSMNGEPNNQNSNNPTYLDPNDFDRNCEIDPDCELVVGGDVCGCADGCGSAVSQSGAAAFYEAQEMITCDPDAEPVPCPAAACEEQIAVCASGTCEAVGLRVIDASQFDQSCEIDDDCVLISTGPICDACDCGRGAINLNAFEDYEQARGDVDCNPGPSPCDCAPATVAWCNEGTCDVE